MAVRLALVLALAGCGASLEDAAAAAVEHACERVTAEECVEAVAVAVCRGTDSVRECLRRYATEEP